MKIAVVHSEYDNLTDKVLELNPRGPMQMKNTLKNISDALRHNGHEVVEVPANLQMLQNIIDSGADLIFCHYMPMIDLNNQGNVFAALELLGLPMVGSGMYAQAVSLSKETTKQVLKYLDIPVCTSQVFFTGSEPLDDDLKDLFPLFVKPESEAQSVGVDSLSKVNNEEEMRAKIRQIIRDYNSPVLVEEYLPGREFTVGILEMPDGSITALPVIELVFEEGSPYQTIDRKASGKTKYVCPADIDKDLEEKLHFYSERTFRALRADTYMRVDCRLDRNGNPVVIEANIMPGIEKGKSSFLQATDHIGMSYEDLIENMVQTAYKKAPTRDFPVGKF